MKPKENKGYNTGTYDECQTPPYALDPLQSKIDWMIYECPSYIIWECAAGKRTLVRHMIHGFGWSVLSTDINDPIGFGDFFGIKPETKNYIIITNPPYSLKYEWLERCYELGSPFALLMPVEMLGTAKGQKLFSRYGIEVIFMSPRVDFYMPHKGYEGAGAQFPVAWFTWKLNLPHQINFARLNKPKRSELKEYWEKALGL
jgi:hypothetical protein